MNAIARLIQERINAPDGPRNVPDIARRGGLPASTVYDLADPESTSIPKLSTLEKLARGLGVPLEVVQRAAAEMAGFQLVDISEPGSDVEILVAVYRELDEVDRRALLDRARMFLEQARREREQRDSE